MRIKNRIVRKVLSIFLILVGFLFLYIALVPGAEDQIINTVKHIAYVGLVILLLVIAIIKRIIRRIRGILRLPGAKSRDKQRLFNTAQKNEIWSRQGGRCAHCGGRLDTRTVQYDHIRPWSMGGRTSLKNGQALCANCHAIKSHEERKRGYH